MILASLVYVRDMLDEFLVFTLGVERGIGIIDQVPGNGAAAEKYANRIVIALVNPECETNRKFYGGQRQDGSRVNQLNAALYFNLDVLLSVNFDDYEGSLQSLSACSSSRRRCSI